jgi:hypothetical protein
MASSTNVKRTHKRPSKFDECFTGDDIDTVVNSESDDNIQTKLHTQCDGKTNNITFKIDLETMYRYVLW